MQCIARIYGTKQFEYRPVVIDPARVEGSTWARNGKHVFTGGVLLFQEDRGQYDTKVLLKVPAGGHVEIEVLDETSV